MKLSHIVALFAAMLFVIPTAQADGNITFGGQLNFGSANLTAGQSSFFFGNPQGGAAIFTGGAETPNGSSRISGEVGLQSNTFVPQGKKGSGEAGGSLSFSYDAFHQQGGIFQNSNSNSVNTWSSSTGNGSASSNVFHRGNVQQWSNAGKG